MTDEDLKALKALEAKATPGPWAYRPERYDDWGYIRAPRLVTEPGLPGCFVAVCREGRTYTSEELDDCRRNGVDPCGDNAKLIAAARNALPYLISDLEAARGEVERLRAALTRWSSDTQIMKLAMGEMTAQEVRSVVAALKQRSAAIRARAEAVSPDLHKTSKQGETGNDA